LDGCGDNYFSLSGKFAGVITSGATPGGVIVKEILVAVNVNVPWKQKRLTNLKVTCCNDDAELVRKLKTGDIIRAEGVIEQTGTKKSEEVKLIATKIKKGETI
jgi:hypothetical protein